MDRPLNYEELVMRSTQNTPGALNPNNAKLLVAFNSLERVRRLPVQNYEQHAVILKGVLGINGGGVMSAQTEISMRKFYSRIATGFPDDAALLFWLRYGWLMLLFYEVKGNDQLCWVYRPPTYKGSDKEWVYEKMLKGGTPRGTPFVYSNSNSNSTSPSTLSTIFERHGTLRQEGSVSGSRQQETWLQASFASELLTFFEKQEIWLTGREDPMAM
jgi:hypothetical protein